MPQGRIIGSFGDVIFSVSADMIKTLRSMTVSASASIQSHRRHLQKPLLEYIGPDNKTITFSLRLSKYLGTDPKVDYTILDQYCRDGVSKFFIIGDEKIGVYKWVVSKIKTTPEYYDGAGNITTIDLSITLTENPKE